MLFNFTRNFPCATSFQDNQATSISVSHCKEWTFRWKPYSSGPTILTYRDPANPQCWSLSHRVTSTAPPFSRQAVCLQRRETAVSLPIATPAKPLHRCEYEGKISAWRAFRHCTSRPKENASSQPAIMWQTFTQTS